MSTPARVFEAPITDEYGGRFTLAVVGILEVGGNAFTGLKSVNCEGNYTVTNEVEAITYKVQYYYSEQTKAEGHRSRPLKNEIDGAFSDVFNVDVDDPEVLAILGSDQGHEEKLLNAVKVDVIRRYR